MAKQTVLQFYFYEIGYRLLYLFLSFFISFFFFYLYIFEYLYFFLNPFPSSFHLLHSPPVRTFIFTDSINYINSAILLSIFLSILVGFPFFIYHSFFFIAPTFKKKKWIDFSIFLSIFVFSVFHINFYFILYIIPYILYFFFQFEIKTIIYTIEPTIQIDLYIQTFIWYYFFFFFFIFFLWAALYILYKYKNIRKKVIQNKNYFYIITVLFSSIFITGDWIFQIVFCFFFSLFFEIFLCICFIFSFQKT